MHKTLNESGSYVVAFIFMYVYIYMCVCVENLWYKKFIVSFGRKEFERCFTPLFESKNRWNIHNKEAFLFKLYLRSWIRTQVFIPTITYFNYTELISWIYNHDYCIPSCRHFYKLIIYIFLKKKHLKSRARSDTR